MRWFLVALALTALAATALPQAPPAESPFARGEAIALDRVIPANERGILGLTPGPKGRVYGGTTGRAAHLFVYDPAADEVRSLFRLPGGVGFAHGLVRLPDGSLIGGTQADPTGTAVLTDPAAVGRLYRFTVDGGGAPKVQELGVPVPGQGIYTLAHDVKTNTVVGNTWPDGHFFSYDVAAGKFTDHGAIAGHRTFEEPRHAADLNRGVKEKTSYPRQVSRAITVDGRGSAFTGGAGGHLVRFDFAARKLEKLQLRLPAVPGREPWASLDAAVVDRRHQREEGDYTSLVGGTSDGYLFELRLFDNGKHQLRPRGRALAQGTIQGLVLAPRGGGGGGGKGKGEGGGEGGGGGRTIHGVGGGREGMPRSI